MVLPLVCPNHIDPVHCFDNKRRKPCTGLCGDTVCLECAYYCRICPVCKLEGQFKKVSVNYTSIDLIEDYRKRFWEKWRGWVDTKKSGAGFYSMIFKETRLLCSICSVPVEIPRICLTCDQENPLKLERWQWIQYDAVVSKVSKQVMCSNCAIENHGEKGHKIVTQEMHKESKKAITIAVAQTILEIFKDAIEHKKEAVDCLLRKMKIEMIGRNLLKLFGEVEYIDKGQCGYLGELIKNELIKKYIENIDEKMFELFGTEGNKICDCSTLKWKVSHTNIRKFAREKPQVFATGCPLYSSKHMADICRKHSISEKAFSENAAIAYPDDVNCPLCVYNDYSQHQKKDFLLRKGMSIIEEICKTEMILLEKCCLRCLDSLDHCRFFLSCEHPKENQTLFVRILNEISDKEQTNKQKSCYQNCFMKNSTLWNFVIINQIMTDENLLEVIIHEIDQTVGLVDCQLQKDRMKETVVELFDGLHCARVWKFPKHWSKPIEMGALFESFKHQWTTFKTGNDEQKAASKCDCPLTWNNILDNKVERKNNKNSETKMIDMGRNSMTEEIHGCPIECSHAIKSKKEVVEIFKDSIGLKTSGEETEMTSAEDEQIKCLMKNIASNVFPFAHLHCQNEEKQLFDNKAHLPCTGSCGHSICSRCVEKTSNGDCPVCRKIGTFDRYQLDVDLLREIETTKQNAWEIFKELWNSEIAEFGACFKCNRYSSDLHIRLNDLIFYDQHGICLRIRTTADVLKLSRHILCEECAQAHVTEEANSIPFWKNHLKKTNGMFLLELLEDEIGGRKNYEYRLIEIQKTQKLLFEVLEELNYPEKNDCWYDRELINLKLIEKLIENIDQSTKQSYMFDENDKKPTGIKNCPLCVMIDYLECATNRSECNRNEWMNAFENFWSTQSPRFEQCCIRCLLYLKNRYNTSCQTETKLVNIKKMGNTIGEGIGSVQLHKFQQVQYFSECKDRNRLVNDKEIWQNLTIREFFFCLLQTMTEGLSKTPFTCHLRKTRMFSLAFHFLSEVSDIWLINDQHWIVCWKFIRTSSMVKNLIIQFKKLKDEMDKEEIGVKCECTDILEKNQIIMKKFGTEEWDEMLCHQLFEDSMERMSRFSLEEDLNGCPMKYNHGIVLNKNIVRKLKETTALGEESSKNECLCVKIDSLGPSATISGANIIRIVSFFINWWRYESSYPHSLCHVCVERLELIQAKLNALVGFYNCELRKMRMLRTFGYLIMLIHDFQKLKLRVSKSDMEDMTKVFDNFISQWNFFQFGSESDQQSLTAGTVCHCTKTLNKSESLLSAKYSPKEMRRKYDHLMETSRELAELYLYETIAGCPLDFDHNIDVDCFLPASSEQSC